MELDVRYQVTVHIKEGLGNQLFQYAVGLAVARRLGARLRSDTSAYLRSRRRRLGLPALGVKLEGAWPGNIAWIARRFGKAVGISLPKPPSLRDTAEFVPEVMTVQAPVRLDGWFQNWRYFEAVAPELRRLYAFDRIALSPGAAAMLQRIAGAPMPVAVHIRRGDYAKTPDVFPLLDAAHYARARARLEADVGSPSYFVFSDQPELAAALVAGWPNATPVSGFSELEDFRLMASCRHFLIANSTFSWWAAWLGRAPDKRVIAPSLWFGPGFGRKIELDQRLPPEWIRV